MSPSTPIVTLRFPDGDVEHRSTRGDLPIGTLIRSRGSHWRVSAFFDAIAVLEPADPPVGPAGAPPVTRTMLGDDIPTVEVMTEA